MRTEAVTAGGRVWLLGLDWRVHEHTPGKTALREMASRRDADWMLLARGQDYVLCGFGDGQAGMKRRKPASAAVALASSHRPPWAGVYQIDDITFWLVAIGEGNLVIPGGDVCGAKETIDAAKKRLEIDHHWEVITGTRAELITALERADPKLSEFVDLAPRPPWVLPAVAFGVAIAAACAWGLHGWIVHERARVAEAKRLAFLHARAQQLSISPVATVPWPEAWITSCLAEAAPLPYSVAGWLLSGWTCEGADLRVDWARGLRATIARRPPGVFDDTGDHVIENFHLPPLRGQGSTPRRRNGRESLLALAQEVNIIPRIDKAAASRPGELPQAALMPNISLGWTHFVLDMPVTPRGVHWDRVYGLRFTKLSRTTDGYHLEGDIYER